jgi:hypothetical protein
MHLNPRCGARTRCDSPCRSPGRRCRMHGSATGNGAPASNRNALQHSSYGREVLEFRRRMRELMRGARELIDVTRAR